MGGGRLAAEYPITRHHVAQVDGAHPVRSLSELCAREKHAHVRLVAELTFHAENAIDRAVAVAGFALRQHFSGRAVICRNGPETPSPQRTSQLHPELRVHDSP